MVKENVKRRRGDPRERREQFCHLFLYIFFRKYRNENAINMPPPIHADF